MRAIGSGWNKKDGWPEFVARAVEKAAGEFFVSKLEPSTAADALGFAAERVECGEHAAALHDDDAEHALQHAQHVAALHDDSAEHAAAKSKAT